MFSRGRLEWMEARFSSYTPSFIHISNFRPLTINGGAAAAPEMPASEIRFVY